MLELRQYEPIKWTYDKKSSMSSISKTEKFSPI